MGILRNYPDANFAGTDFEKYYPDARLTPGSLMLIDPTHSQGGITAATTGQTFNNIAYETFNEIASTSETASSCGATFTHSFTAPYGAFELSDKGALYGVVSNTDQNSQLAYIDAKLPFEQYIKNNPSREYSVFIWCEVTRAAGGSSANLVDGYVFANGAGTSSNNLLLLSLTNSTGLQRYAKNAPTGMTGSPNASDGLNRSRLFAWGNDPAFDALNPDVGRSVSIFGIHVIDVALSGMTHEELAARDLALFTAATSEGGRLYDDSYDLVLGDYP